MPALGDALIVGCQKVDAFAGTGQGLYRISQFPLNPCFLLIGTANEPAVPVFFFYRQGVTGSAAFIQGFVVCTGLGQKPGVV